MQALSLFSSLRLLAFVGLGSVWLCPVSAWSSPESPDGAKVGQAPSVPAGQDSEKITVTGTRTPERRGDSAVATEVISRSEIERLGVTDLGQLMTLIGGAQVDRSFAGTGVALQGLDAKQTLILVDGERVLGAKDGIVDLTRFNSEQVQRIEIVRGAGSALYGADAIAGVVNIITRKSPKKIYASAEGLYGTDESIAVSGRVGGRYRRVRSQLLAGMHTAPAFDLEPNDGLPQTHGSEVDDWYIRNNTTLMLSKRTQLSTMGEYARRDRIGVDASQSGAEYDRRQLADLYDARVRFQHKTSEGTRFVSSVRLNHLRDQFLRDQRRSDRQDRYEDSYLWLGQANAQVDIRLPARHVLSLGFDGIYEQAESPRLVRTSACQPDMLTNDCQTADRLRGAAYAQDIYTILLDPYLVVVAGGRIEGDSEYGYETVPRVAVRYDPIQAVKLRISVGKGYRAPAFRELYLRFDNPSVGYTVQGNPLLEPEVSTSYQGSVDWAINAYLKAHLASFYNDVRGLIDFQQVDDGQMSDDLQVFRLSNFAQATTYGSQSELVLGGLTFVELRVGYHFLEAIDETRNRQLPGRANHQFSSALSVRYPSLGLTWTTAVVYTGERTFYEPDEDDRDVAVTADPYVNVSSNIAWQFIRWGRVFCRAENLLDEGRVPYLSQRPRRFLLGLNLTL
ncbi:MAG: TonB-dependent receptor [Myxococcota bacterium]|nr:TonB-dependent receptor [Myxococcota bacterium]